MTSSPLIDTLILPAVGGLIVGFAAGIIVGVAVALRWITRRTPRGDGVPIYHDDTNPTPGHRPWRGREHFSRLGWVFVALGVIGIVLGSVSLYQNNKTAAQSRATAACVAEFTQVNAIASKARSEAGDLDRQAIRKQRAIAREFNQVMIDAVTNPVTDPEAREKARVDFLAKAQDWDARLAEVDRLDHDAEQQRLQNPLPTQPDC